MYEIGVMHASTDLGEVVFLSKAVNLDLEPGVIPRTLSDFLAGGNASFLSNNV